MTNVVIIDYGSGNLRSAAKAFERAAAGNANIVVTNNPHALENASHIVLPGVGAFADCMRGIEAIAGMRVAMEKQVLEKQKPFLGICVGMQMLFEAGYEHGVHKGMGWIEGEVVKIGVSCEKQVNSQPTTRNSQLKIPHIGWNDFKLTQPSHPLLTGITSGDHAYFIHSYHAVCDASDIIATTDYGQALAAAVAKGNIMGTQFHPEKSQGIGLRLIGNFLNL